MNRMTKSMIGVMLIVLGTNEVMTYAAGTDTAVLYRFDEEADAIMAGEFLTDSSGNERHAKILFGNQIGIVEGQAGYGQAGSFNGSIAGVEIEDVDTSGDFTFGFWMKSGSLSQTEKYLVTRGTGTGGVQVSIIYQYVANTVEFYTVGADTRTGSQILVPDMDWHHIVYTRTGSDFDGYLDGQKRDIKDIADVLPLLPYLTIGGADPLRDGGGLNLYEGLLDDVVVMTRGVGQGDVDFIMQGFVSDKAYLPSPIVGAADLPREVELSWQAGVDAVTHNVYLGTNGDDVNNAGIDSDLLVAQGLSDAAYDAGALALGQTYYWRVDEVGSTTYKGDVWSFTTEPVGYPIANVTAEASGAQAASPANRTVDESGLDDLDQHGTDMKDMWVNPSGFPAWIQFTFDKVYKLHEMWVWNGNSELELLMGFGAKVVVVECSTDGETWVQVENAPEFARGTAAPTYTANTVVDLGGATAKHVRLTINDNWGATTMVSLSEVRFFYIPVRAREAMPANGATDVAVDTDLSWRPGREAVSHEVYLGADPEALERIDTTDANTITPGPLDLGTTYYWRIDEVNNAEAVSVWQGAMWSFSTLANLVVENFESYTDDIDADEAIFQTWTDGYDDDDNGSQVGYLDSPFTEKTIVHDGADSMPLSYSNVDGVTVSEATRTFAPAQDWSANGIRSLKLWFYGVSGNTGDLYVKINNAKIAYSGDRDNIAINIWHAWDIDLTAVNGIDNVKSLTVGVAGADVTGMLYIDDIRLSPEEAAVDEWGDKLAIRDYEWAPAEFRKTPADPGYWGSDPDMTKLTDGVIASDYSGGLCAGWNYDTTNGAFGPTLYFDLGSIQNIGVVAIYHQPRCYGFQTVEVSVSSLDNPNRVDIADMADWTGEEVYESEYWGVGASGNAPSVMQVVPVRQEGRWVRLQFLNQEPGYKEAWTMFSEFMFYSE